MNNKPVLNINDVDDYLTYYNRVRHDSELLCNNLQVEDYGIQTMPEVSPPKWHLAHTSWFFETFILKPFYKNYKEFNSHFSILFNSYYDTIGDYFPREQRGLLSRPTVAEVYHYRHHVDKNMSSLLLDIDHLNQQEIIARTILGVNHEQQHQELILTDIKHIFASNPLKPVYHSVDLKKNLTLLNRNKKKIIETELNWLTFNGGVESIGFTGEGFFYDNETPNHKVYVENFELASKPVNCGQYLKFIHAGGYSKAKYWLSDAWKMVTKQQWRAPLYWSLENNNWMQMTLSGKQELDESAPVCHVSYYEAAAYTQWLSETEAGVRLPSEAEWEIAALDLPMVGNFRENELYQPVNSHSDTNSVVCLQQMFGDVWEWTQSAYTPYPGYRVADGALGEYNGKFMCSQMVLRGGSCVTASDHIRASYRNFFYPHERWQFSGFRLARDLL